MEDIKRFWEWCGLKWFWYHNPNCQCGAKDDDGSERSWMYKAGNKWKLATRFYNEPMVIDLNNLFKWAVPKLGEDLEVELFMFSQKWFCQLKTRTTIVATSGHYCGDPAQALYQAICKVMEAT